MTTKTAEVKTFEVVTEPTAKTISSRAVSIPMGVTVNKHYNDDGSITLYAKGLKIHRTASDEDMEGEEDWDAEVAAEKFLKKWFGRGKAIVIGRVTRSHNWKKRQKSVSAD